MSHDMIYIYTYEYIIWWFHMISYYDFQVSTWIDHPLVLLCKMSSKMPMCLLDHVYLLLREFLDQPIVQSIPQKASKTAGWQVILQQCNRDHTDHKSRGTLPLEFCRDKAANEQSSFQLKPWHRFPCQCWMASIRADSSGKWSNMIDPLVDSTFLWISGCYGCW